MTEPTFYEVEEWLRKIEHKYRRKIEDKFDPPNIMPDSMRLQLLEVRLLLDIRTRLFAQKYGG